MKKVLLVLLGAMVPIVLDYIKNDTILVYDYKIIPILDETSNYFQESKRALIEKGLPNQRLQVRILNLGLKAEENIAVTIPIPGEFIDTKNNNQLKGYEWEFDSLLDGDKLSGSKKKLEPNVQSIVDVYFSKNESINKEEVAPIIVEKHRLQKLDDIEESWLFYYTWPISTWILGPILGVLCILLLAASVGFMLDRVL